MSVRTAGLLPVVAFFATTVAGCRSAAPSPYETPSEVSRSTVEAEALSRKGADLVEEAQQEAERVLREALTKDLYYGPPTTTSASSTSSRRSSTRRPTSSSGRGS